MFNAQDWEDLNYIFDLKDAEADENYITGVSERGFEVYKRRMNFFKPFDDRHDFARDLYTIIRCPFAFAMGSAISAFNTIVGACFVSGNLILTMGALIFMDDESLHSVLSDTAQSLVYTGTMLLGTAAHLLLALISIPYNTASLVSRIAATLIPPLGELYVEPQSSEFVL